MSPTTPGPARDEPRDFEPNCSVTFEQLDRVTGGRMAASAGVSAYRDDSADPPPADDGSPQAATASWKVVHVEIHGGLVHNTVAIITGPQGDRWEAGTVRRTDQGRTVVCENCKRLSAPRS